MNNNKLLISAAGSGKTTFIVNTALDLDKSQKILITTSKYMTKLLHID